MQTTHLMWKNTENFAPYNKRLKEKCVFGWLETYLGHYFDHLYGQVSANGGKGTSISETTS